MMQIAVDAQITALLLDEPVDRLDLAVIGRAPGEIFNLHKKIVAIDRKIILRQSAKREAKPPAGLRVNPTDGLCHEPVTISMVSRNRPRLENDAPVGDGPARIGEVTEFNISAERVIGRTIVRRLLVKPGVFDEVDGMRDLRRADGRQCKNRENHRREKLERWTRHL